LPLTDGEDDETCGFCIYMKAGGCKPEFQVNGMLTAASTSAKNEFVLSAQIMHRNGASVLMLRESRARISQMSAERE